MLGIISSNPRITEHDETPSSAQPRVNPRSWSCTQRPAELQTTFPQLSVDAENFQSYKKYVETFTKATSIQYYEVKRHRSVSGGLWAQITGVLGIFLKMHYHMLALLFYFSKLF